MKIVNKDGSVTDIENPELFFPKISRLEVIDETGRAYVNMNVSDLSISIQDEGRTLKIFL